MADGGRRRWSGARRKTGVAAAMVLAGSMAGSPPAGAGPRLTADALAAAADGACIEAGEQLGALFADLFPTGNELPPADEAAPIMAEAALVVARYADTITALKPPLEHQADWLEIERRTRQLDRLIQRSADAAADGETDGYLTVLGEANGVDLETRPLFESVGAVACSGEPS